LSRIPTVVANNDMTPDCTHWGVSRSFDVADILRHFDVLRHCKLTIFGSFALIRKISFGLELIESSSVFLLSNSYPRACEPLCRIDNPLLPGLVSCLQL
jgi:hypothetical protein